jgi:hypothetical protein
MYYVRFPLRLRQAEDILLERRIDICHEIVLFRGAVLASCWQKKFGIIGQDIIQTDVGTLMKFLSKSTVGNSSSGVLSILTGLCWKAMFHNVEIAAPYMESINGTAFQIRFSSCNSHG